MPSVQYWASITYGNGTFVAVATAPSSTAASSTDGITWATRTMPSSSIWQSVTYGNGIFVAITYNSATAAISTDGITWTTRTLPSSQNWISVTAAPIQNNINSQLIQGQYVGPITLSTYTVGTYDKYITFNPSATTTVTLPNAALYPNREITIKNIAAFAFNSASSNVIPLASNTAGTAILASTAGKYAKLVSDGNFWVIMEAN